MKFAVCRPSNASARAAPRAHRKRRCDLAGHAFDIMGIDQQGRVELLRRAREIREHQYARIEWVLCRDIFLGDQVHAVLERRDQSDLRDAVESGQRRLRIAAVEIADRDPVDFAMPAVDLADQGGELGLQLPIGADIAARRHGDLQEARRSRLSCGSISACGRMPDPVGEALGIVETVDPKHELLALQTPRSRDTSARDSPVAPTRIVDIDADREGRRDESPPTRSDCAVDTSKAKLDLDVILEIADGPHRSETDQIIGEHRL